MERWNGGRMEFGMILVGACRAGTEMDFIDGVDICIGVDQRWSEFCRGAAFGTRFGPSKKDTKQFSKAI